MFNMFLDLNLYLFWFLILFFVLYFFKINMFNFFFPNAEVAI